MSETDIERVLERSHPAANLFPMMGDAELWELAEDIGRQGLEDDIILHEGLILDGRNRWVACERAGVEQRTAVWQSNGASPTAYVISKNLHRRHLTPAQRAAIAAEALPMFEAEARERRHRDTERIPDHELGEAREKAAEQFDVNPRYIQDAKRFKDHSPAIFDRVKSGEMSIPQARTAERIEAAAPDVFQKIVSGEQSVPEAAKFLFTDPVQETDEERAYFGIVSKTPTLTKYDPAVVAAACSDAEARLPAYERVVEWMGRFVQELRAQGQRPLRAVK